MTLQVFCVLCKHYTNNSECAAFPNGIPDIIWIGQNNHENHYPGDNGIQYELAEGVNDESGNNSMQAV